MTMTSPSESLVAGRRSSAAGQNSVLVIGAGLAGLTAGWQALAQGKRVRVVAEGWGALYWHAGCVDVLGYYPLESREPVASPAEAVQRLTADNPRHPYALAGLESLDDALGAFQALCGEYGYPLHGSLERNWLLPSAVGTFRPTCLAPETMIAGDLSHNAPMLIVGFRQLGDFYANVVADNLAHQGIPAQAVTLDLPTLRARNFITPVILSDMMDRADFRAEVVEAVRPHLGQAERIGFPAVLGMEEPLPAKQDLEAKLGRPVFEIAGLPPSVPGIRLFRILRDRIEQSGGYVYDGMRAVAATHENGRVTAVYTEAAARQRRHRYDQFVLATGGILGGGIRANHKGEVCEAVFDLPVTAPASRLEWFKRDFLDREGHPIYRAGLTVNEHFLPVDRNRRPLYDNLFAAGTTLAHCEVIRERSFDGVGLVTGYAVGKVVGD